MPWWQLVLLGIGALTVLVICIALIGIAGMIVIEMIWGEQHPKYTDREDVVPAGHLYVNGKLMSVDELRARWHNQQNSKGEDEDGQEQ